MAINLLPSATLLLKMLKESYLRLDQDQINKQHDIVVFHVFIGEPLATRTLREAHALA
jgi:hypothetical protein